MTPTPAPQGLTDSALIGAIARGWCHDLNKHKEMDPALVIAIATEVRAFLASVSPIQPAVGGMTDEEILAIAAKHNWGRGRINVLGFARALLASTSPRPTAAGWLEALRELLEAEEAPHPTVEDGTVAIANWAIRRHNARERAREILAASPAQTGEPLSEARLLELREGRDELSGDAVDAFARAIEAEIATRQTGGVDQAWVDEAMRLARAIAVVASTANWNALRTHLSTALGAAKKD